MLCLTRSVLATLVVLGAQASIMVHAADATYPSPLVTPATDDVLFAGGAPTAVSAAQVKVGGGTLAAGTAVGIGSTPVTGQGQLQIQPGAGNVTVRLNGGKTTAGEGSAFVCGQGGGYNQAIGNWSGVIGGTFDNTGILFSATAWKITTGGSTARMTVDNAGNVGIGTQTPTALLHVNGNLMVAGKNAGGSAHFGSGSDNISNTNNGISVQETNTALPVAIGLGSTTGSSVGLLWTGTYGALYTFGNASPLVYSASSHQFSNGNVGIGAAPAAGLGLLQLASGTTKANGIDAGNDTFLFREAAGSWLAQSLSGPAQIAAIDSTGASKLVVYADSGSGILSQVGNKPLNLRTNNVTAVTVDALQNVGIGTTSPASMGSGGSPRILQVHAAAGGTDPYGLLELSTAAAVAGKPCGQIDFGVASVGRTALIRSLAATTGASPSGSMDFFTSASGTLIQRMIITETGNVGIGVPAPTSALAVNGTISAKEIKVVANPADYVFADGYRLRPLAEVEAFIAAHQHLPGVPSAKEQEETGEMVAEMMRAHLEKIEELNLYVIQQQKAIERLEAQLKIANDLTQAQMAPQAAILARLGQLEAQRHPTP